jgi:predicted secreted protein
LRLGSILAIYLLFWVASAFLLLPFGVRTDEEVGADKVAGQADSAPHRFDVAGHVLRATVLATVLFLFYTPIGTSAGSPPTTWISTTSPGQRARPVACESAT